MSEKMLVNAEQQLRGYLHKSDSKAGLLIYCDIAGRDFPSQPAGWPLVVRWSIRELATALATKQLAERLITARHQVVHGRE